MNVKTLTAAIATAAVLIGAGTTAALLDQGSSTSPGAVVQVVPVTSAPPAPVSLAPVNVTPPVVTPAPVVVPKPKPAPVVPPAPKPKPVVTPVLFEGKFKPGTVVELFGDGEYVQVLTVNAAGTGVTGEDYVKVFSAPATPAPAQVPGSPTGNYPEKVVPVTETLDGHAIQGSYDYVAHSVEPAPATTTVTVTYTLDGGGGPDHVVIWSAAGYTV